MDQHIAYLLAQYKAGRCTMEELSELQQLFESETHREVLESALMKILQEKGEAHPSVEQALARVLQHTDRRLYAQSPLNELKSEPLNAQKRVARISKQWVAVAAALLLCGTIGYFIWQYENQPQDTATVAQSSAPIQPASGKATLMLPDGRVINLGSNGKITTLDMVEETKNRVIYHLNDQAKSNIPQLHTIATPRGGTYQVELADGTQVWLNAASSITFPTRFTGETREIEIQGEVFIQVTPHKNRPFLVHTGSQTIEVLGTAFNISAYADQREITTALVEGGLRVIDGGNSVRLTPGEMAINTRGNKPALIKEKADLDRILAWRNGIFRYNGQPIEDIMAEVGRWYDVDVRFEGDVFAKRFAGEISRFQNVTDVLDIIALTGSVNIKLEGREIIVKPR